MESRFSKLIKSEDATYIEPSELFKNLIREDDSKKLGLESGQLEVEHEDVIPIPDPFFGVESSQSGVVPLTKTIQEESDLQSLQWQYQTAFNYAQAYQDCRIANEDVQSGPVYNAWPGELYLLVESRNERIRSFKVLSGIASVTMRRLQTLNWREEIIALSFLSLSRKKEIFIRKKDIKGERLLNRLVEMGCFVNLEIPKKKRIEAINTWILTWSAQVTAESIPIQRGWFFGEKEVEFWDPQNTWQELWERAGEG